MFKPFALPVVASLSVALLASWLLADGRISTAPPDALRENTPKHWAITNARIVVSPTQTIERGTLVFRDGTIVAVGADVAAPTGARVLDLPGKTIYPGLIEPYSEPSAAGAGASGRGGAGGITMPGAAPQQAPSATPAGGASHWNSNVTPETRVEDTFRPDADLNKKLRSQGVVARLAAPSRGVLKGVSCVVDTSDGSAKDSLVRNGVAMHATFSPPRGRGDDDDRYPSSPMGALALVRQVLYDAQWYRAAEQAHAQNPQLPRPEKSAALEALARHVEAKAPFLIDAADELYALRAGRLAEEFGLPVIVRGSGSEYRRLAEVAAMKIPVLVPVSFPKAPNVASPEYAVNVTLFDLMEWDLAPDNPATLAKAGVTIALTGHGLRDRAEFLKNVRRAVARGLDKPAALAAMTTTPAQLLGVQHTLGTLDAGKQASFVITDGELFDEKTKVLETWVEGERFEIAPKPVVDPRGKWALSLGGGKTIEVNVEGDTRLTAKLTPPAAPAANEPATRPTTRPSTVDAANVVQQDARLSFTFKHDRFGGDGVAVFSAVFEPDSAVGTLVLPDGAERPVTLKRTAGPSTQPSSDRRTARRGAGGGGGAAASGDEEGETTKPSSQPAKPSYAVNYPFGDFGRDAPTPEQPKVVVFRNATVWTAGGEGTIENADVIVEAGKIRAVGKNLSPPAGAVVVDCTGKHVAPGIIDCHSHMATDGGVNEGGQNITAEVRISDFVDPDDINIYRQLASGITAANVLHGSANAIGGQNQVIKLRWGTGPEELKFQGAPPGIKFALGENPRGANSSRARNDTRPLRYPQTRMGVDQLINNAFAAATDYRAAQKRYADDPKHNPPVQKDLELEAIAEILEGKRLIHCHSYRQDEILAFLRTCERFGVKIATLQHILEGFKVADAMAKHGAMASCFSDWWAYKLEVYDAIPYAGALMHNAGVVVSFNSDDAEMARRLNSEAAKATKYGGVPPAEAIKFVTLNPARQLRIDDRVGSIEPGKDADLAVWNAPPMSMFAVCQQTWVDGRKYFDREEDARLRARDAEMRRTLIQKILASGEPMAGEDEAPVRERALWAKEDLYCGHGEHDHDDHDE